MNIDTIFRIAILVLVIMAVSISAYFRTRAAKASPDKPDRSKEGVRQLVLLRLAGFAVWGSVLVYIINPSWIAFATIPLPDAVRWFGLLLSIAAVPLLFWMFKSLGGNITDTVDTRQNAALVTVGPYRWIRHPLYSFGTLFFVGIILMTANWLIALFGVTALTLLALRTPKEEERLVAKFGDDYRGYMANTGRYVPKLTR